MKALPLAILSCLLALAGASGCSKSPGDDKSSKVSPIEAEADQKQKKTGDQDKKGNTDPAKATVN